MLSPNFEEFPMVHVEAMGQMMEGWLLAVTDDTTIVLFDGAPFPIVYDNDSLREIALDYNTGDVFLPANGSVICEIDKDQLH